MNTVSTTKHTLEQSTASCSCKAHSDLLQSIGEMKEKQKSIFARAEAILFTLDINHKCGRISFMTHINVSL